MIEDDLRKLAAQWRAESRKYDEIRLEHRLNGCEGCNEHELAKQAAEIYNRCAYYLLSTLGPIEPEPYVFKSRIRPSST